ncbi:STAS domain-containing protein [Streptomyces scopuliridis]|uniref:STAS domain-containing protein n=1 Tax=Streptomyces scopuliridis TaxID=452529 RepID=UPI002DD7ADEF|nr:STAS domain-containing protein [Streptomyces scopuliridis]WSB33838.1 STAS domain-containing protein [Streptomyces scopuliridis]
MSSGRRSGLPSVDATKPIVLVIAGHLTPAEVPRFYEELYERLYGELATRPDDFGAAEVICEVGGLVRPNLAAVEVLARLRLDARRRGCRVRLRGAARELRLLLDLVGLGDMAL